MLPNFWTFLANRCPPPTRLVICTFALLGILGFFINIHISFLVTNLDICFPKNNIVFLKTHKCAGSSIQNILMRYGDAHKLTFVLPRSGNYLGHPTPFSRTMISTPRLPTYNILAHHTRLNYREIRNLMPINSVFITIVRDPVEVFESAYSYYGLGNILGGDIHHFLANISAKNEKAIHRRFGRKFGSNQMMFDLGADPLTFTNDTLVKKYINKLDTWFHLVLVADRMDESLVLLRHLMCWDIDDVITFKLNARDPEFKTSLSEKERGLLKRVNHADVLLYEHFLQKFEKAIDAFGRDRMMTETNELRGRTQKWYNLCIKKQQRHAKPTAKPRYYFNPKVLVFEANSENNSTCKSMTLEELMYTDILRQKQFTRLAKTFSSTLLRSRYTFRAPKKSNHIS